MVDLTQEYRPLRFRDVVGQASAVSWLKGQIRSRERRSVLIAGPVGTGKTSSGLIYARAILCDSPDDGEPCGRCANCREFDARERVPDFRFVKCGEQGGIERVQELLDFARTAPFSADRRVLILDEAHNLSRRSRQALLNVAERPPQWVTFILTTSEKNDLPESLLSRLPSLDLESLKQADALAFMAEICIREGTKFQPAALDLIFGDAGGCPRRLLRALEKVSTLGPVDEANVRSALSLDFDELLAGYLAALLDGDLRRQLHVIEDWLDTPQRKLAFLHQFLAFCYFQDICSIERSDCLMRNLPEALRARLVREFAGRAARLKIDVHTFWQEAVAALEPQDILTRAQLAMTLSRFDRLINGSRDSVAADSRQCAMPLHRRQQLRVQDPSNHPALSGRRPRSIGADARAAYLSWPQVKPIWEIGSFLPQQFGLLFNLRLTLRYGALGIQQNEGATQLLSDLTHDLGARIAWWVPGCRLHWVYRHEVDRQGGLLSRVLLAIPDQQLAPSLQWLDRFVTRRAAGGASNKSQSEGALLASCRPNASRGALLRFHWQGIRALSRGLDPGLNGRDENGIRRPLVNLLRVPLRWREPIGDLRTAQDIGASKALTRNARRRVAHSDMPLLSALKERAWPHIDVGWELDEHRARLTETARRESAIAEVHLRFPGADEISIARRKEGCLACRASFNPDPKSWLRTWVGWWQPSETGLRS